MEDDDDDKLFWSLSPDTLEQQFRAPSYASGWISKCVGLEQRFREPLGSRNPQWKIDARSCSNTTCIGFKATERTEESSTKTRCSELLQGDVIEEPSISEPTCERSRETQAVRLDRYVCMADTHGQHGELAVPAGDVLVHAGDATRTGSPAECEDFVRWIEDTVRARSFRCAVLVAGNHDAALADAVARLQPERVTLLNGSRCAVTGAVGTPFSVDIVGAGWWAYGCADDREMADRLLAVTSLAPVDVLLTHEAPLGIGDTTAHGRAAGSGALAAALARLRPRLHVFGHIHEGRGAYRVHYRGVGGELSEHTTLCINAACCNHRGQLEHQPVVVELPVDARDVVSAVGKRRESSDYDYDGVMAATARRLGVAPRIEFPPRISRDCRHSNPPLQSDAQPRALREQRVIVRCE